jgi:hypothetical protein
MSWIFSLVLFINISKTSTLHSGRSLFAQIFRNWDEYAATAEGKLLIESLESALLRLSRILLAPVCVSSSCALNLLSFMHICILAVWNLAIAHFTLLAMFSLRWQAAWGKWGSSTQLAARQRTLYRSRKAVSACFFPLKSFFLVFKPLHFTCKIVIIYLSLIYVFIYLFILFIYTFTTNSFVNFNVFPSLFYL